MKTVATLVLNCLFMVLFTGCAGHGPFRPKAEACPVDAASQPDCSAYSVERRPDFSVAYVELTDQGLFHRRDQLEEALRLVSDTADRTPTQVVVFVHGWKHSAQASDPDVMSFTNNVMPLMKAQSPEAATVGIFVGWRGASMAVGKNLTFYDRKSSADHVARGSLRELLANLRAIRARDPAKYNRVKVVVVGHSFGGLILFNAIAGATMDGLVQAGYEPAANTAASPIYDIAVLLNPAFEATRFEPLFQAAKRREKNARRIPWPDGQHPLLMSITSEGDWATKIAFPLGRVVNSVFQKESWIDQDEAENIPEWSAERVEKQANTHTVGHLARYRTHVLTLAGSGANGRAQCTPVENKFVDQSNNFPLWNMLAARDVSADHGDIYGRPLWEFIARVASATDSRQPICEAAALPALP